LLSVFLRRSRDFLAPFFIDPLSVKELSGIARRWQTYVGRGLYIGLIAVIVWIFWSSLTMRGSYVTSSAYAELGHYLFVSFIILQLIVSTLGGMSAGSDMVTREIRNGTLGILALTPLSNWRIAAGKWKAALVQTSTGVLCGIPVLAVIAYLGGIGLWEFAYSFTLSLSCAALGAAIGLFCSTVFRTGYAASTVSIILLLLYCLLPNLLFATSLKSEDVLDVLSWIHPLYAAIGAVGQGTFGHRMGAQAYGWIPLTLVVSLQVWMLLWCSAGRIGELILGTGSGTTSSGPAAAGPRGSGTSGFARLLRGGGPVWQRNAILWKELSTRRLGTAARIGLGILAVLLLSTVADTQGWWRVLLYWVSWIILLLVSISAGVSLFVTEREERKWDVLLCTPLQAHDIVLAKLFAGLAGLAPMGLLLAAFWALIELLRGVTLLGMVMNMVTLAQVMLLAFVLGAAASLHARSQRVAFSASFGIVIGYLFVFPILLLLLQSFSVFSSDVQFAETIICWTNPAVYMTLVSGPLAMSGEWFSGEAQRHRELEALPRFMVYVALYLGLISFVVYGMVARFDRATGRS
jgi:ABC-type transport system involved in multi-copper enzyme maturation permease subunit